MLYRIYKRTLRWVRNKERKEWESRAISSFAESGSSLVLRYRSNFVHPARMSVGSNVWIGENGWFQAVGGISIGSNVVISRNCTIFSGYHDYTEDLLPYGDRDVEKPVTICDNVWIGMNVTIVPGVTIGEGAIIGMGTTVTGDVPALAIVGCAPHRILKYRDADAYSSAKSNQRFRDVTKRA